MKYEGGIKRYVKTGEVTAGDAIEILRMKASLNDGTCKFLEQTRTYQWLDRRDRKRNP